MSNQELWAVFFRYLNDPGMRAKINQIAKREEGIEMAGTVLLGLIAKGYTADDIRRELAARD